MFLVRLLALLIAAAIAANLVFWLLTGRSQYLNWAIRLGKFALLATALVVLLLFGERLIVP